ncbi:DOMON-like domain-containing protein [Novosphingobium sp. ZW T3_23]|uniref:DOMON-like domain-containing protein n=1 Tax=Novosphingobium sp. ZW T3_23 TaxID=3378084 RepID=UPI0038536BB7
MADLTCHPAHPPALVRSIETRVIGFDASWLRIRWRILGAQKLVVPSFAGKGRANDLWQTTCFELFLQQPGGSGYIEFNLSPSERWNAYDFSGRREGMTERPMPREPECTMRKGSDIAVFDVAIPAAGLPEGPMLSAVTAVIEEEGGVKSYWAMLHRADVPDFHDPACFTVPLAAPTGT